MEVFNLKISSATVPAPPHKQFVGYDCNKVAWAYCRRKLEYYDWQQEIDDLWLILFTQVPPEFAPKRL